MTHNPDGSWSWMKGMPASEWITRQVLSALGQIRVAGYMPSDAENRRSLEKMIDAAIRYTDSEQSKAYRDIITRSKGQYPLESELSYLYLRSNAGVSAPQGLIADMKRDMFKRLPGEWRGLDIDDKAIAAIMLWREGQKELAQTILESVRQYASYKSDKGMWFDRQPKQYFASSSLLLTARCLDAFREIDPDSDAVAQLSQFLVLSRQTTDWNLELGQAGVASVVSSVVRSIKEDWTTAADISDADNGVRIMLGNKEISVPANAQLLTGNFCLNLDTADASGEELHIVRNNSSPAWGGVMNQYIAPIKDVKASGVPQLKISKMLLPLTTEKDGIKASRPSTVFHKGDRVKVTLTIESDRDLDYILISDQLGAWMQPASQLTEYGFQDGLLMLTETRTSKKNYYITRMPKGKY
ncbi:MAG: hypothetical protein K2J15_01535, partial [Muribaculaceae bacterium]|nr:hypothetical protein [Muribaculaceae bacterium]